MNRRWHEPAEAPGYFQGSHDLTGEHISLLPVAGELREREAARAARAARRRGSWLARLGRWVRERRARAAEQQVAVIIAQVDATIDREISPRRQEFAERLEELHAGGMLAVARAAALRDDRPDLAAAIHAVLILDLTGSLDELAPIVAAVRAAFQEAPGDDPRAVN